jgi:predicted transcriptional regulator
MAESRAARLAARADRDKERAKLLAELEEVTEERQAAEAKFEEKRQAQSDLLVKGAKQGVPVAHLADASGLSRSAIYDMQEIREILGLEP